MSYLGLKTPLHLEAYWCGVGVVITVGGVVVVAAVAAIIVTVLSLSLFCRCRCRAVLVVDVESLLVLSHGLCHSHDSISQDLHIRKSQWVGEPLGQLLGS